jgi:uncharacterized protein (DUF2147 family)
MHRFSLLLLLVSIIPTSTATAQKDPLCKIWYNEEKTSKLEITQTGNTFQATIVWLQDPLEDGKPKLDKENPNATLRTKPIQGLTILNGLKKSSKDPNFYEDGRIYDPKNGKTYDCRMTYKGGSIELRGYVMGIPFLGRTSTWWLAEGQ